MLANPDKDGLGEGPDTHIPARSPEVDRDSAPSRRPAAGGFNAVRFADCARIVGEVARSGALAAPAFRSPPRRPEIDRSVMHRDGRAIIAVRRRGRPAAAVQADLIEGVVVVNDLDPVEAARFRSQAWAALAVTGSAPARRPEHAECLVSDNRSTGAGDRQDADEVDRIGSSSGVSTSFHMVLAGNPSDPRTSANEAEQDRPFDTPATAA